MVKMMLRETVDFNQSNEFSVYCETISNIFCPFLKPAESQKVLFATTYMLTGTNIKELQENMFYCGIIHMERLRQYRFKYENFSKGILACENVIFKLPQKFENIDGQRLFSWPHWLLKILYTQVGIMVGKFWIGEQLQGRNGLQIPSPPCHFFSLRSAIKERDPYFFTCAQQLLADLS